MNGFGPVGCALIGVGMIGRSHAEVLAGSPSADLLACCDIDANAAGNVPPGVPFLDDVGTTLDLPGLEAVFVCTPQDAHLPVTLAALERGLHVFCEKPIAASLADADAMISAASRGPGQLAIGHTLRFDPDYAAIHEAVRAGRLGTVVSLSARRCVPDFEGKLLADRTNLPVEVGVHDLDVLLGLAGGIDRVYAEPSSTNVLGTGLVDALVGTLTFTSGAVAAIELNWITASASHFSSDYRLAVFGTGGSGFAEFRTPSVLLYTGDGVELARTHWLADLHGTLSGVLRTEDEHFLATVRGVRSWPVTLVDAREALAVALALAHSAKVGLPIRLSEFRSDYSPASRD